MTQTPNLGPLSLPALPPRVSRLNELVYNLWWSWNHQAREVFRRLDYQLWRRTAHNPVLMLRQIAPEVIQASVKDQSFLSLYNATLASLDAARSSSDTWWAQEFPSLGARPIAYFSAEFAFHQSLPIYAGGLGVLAGDHLKEASDLGLPLVGVGFMYPQGYFHQKVSAEGWQEEVHEQLNWADAPIQLATTPAGKPCILAVPLGARSVLVQVWRVQLGRVQLYLLDTGLEENAPWDRELSARLYGGDRETRIQQEIILGIGGVRALRVLGIDPVVFHLNEGHAAFVVLQRIRELLDHGRAFDDALAEVRRTTVFTTHTPVAAGHDAFPFNLIEKHLAGAWGTLGAHREAFLALGEYNNGSGPLFNLTALALRTAASTNAVSRAHGRVTCGMWTPIWGDEAQAAAHVQVVTNGVHLPTWVSTDMSRLFERYLGSDWREHQEDPDYWDGVLQIPDEELWAVRQALRTFLFSFIRERARRRWAEEQVSAARVVAAGTLLDPAALTIGFARRFTGYKRPELLFRDPDRLARILNAPRRPVQVVFAGKAHPADDPGKRHLQRVYTHAVDPKFGGRVAFVDDYDLHVAHFLVQGCDVWLNTPRKPLEASGTSGMKASINGVPHLSISDGWWAEGYTDENGWLIEGEPGATTDDEQDARDVEAIYRLLEEEIVPTFYDRDARGIPRRWLAIVKEAIRTVTPRFCTRRMVKEYAVHMYAPPVKGGEAIAATKDE
jgi:starch phosphorylase